jgi:hypothetical protein
MHDLVDEDSDINALAEDMSVLLRQRVVSGYGSDAHKNVGLCEASLAEFWRWIGRESSVSPSSILNLLLTLRIYSEQELKPCRGTPA